jgi:hypothetical protein
MEMKRTFRNRRHPSSLGQLICSQHSHKDRKRHNAQPPTDGIANHIDLLLELARTGPERDAAEEERPVDRARGVRVRVGEAGVVLEHGDLQLEEFAEEVHRLDLLALLGRGTDSVGRI